MRRIILNLKIKFYFHLSHDVVLVVYSLLLNILQLDNTFTRRIKSKVSKMSDSCDNDTDTSRVAVIDITTGVDECVTLSPVVRIIPRHLMPPDQLPTTMIWNGYAFTAKGRNPEKSQPGEFPDHGDSVGT
jgi:hypothetical protein